MSIGGISTAGTYSPSNYNIAPQRARFGADIQQLGQDLQSGNLSAAQQDFATLQQDGPSGSSSSSTTTTLKSTNNPVSRRPSTSSATTCSRKISRVRSRLTPIFSRIFRVHPKPRLIRPTISATPDPARRIRYFCNWAKSWRTARSLQRSKVTARSRQMCRSAKSARRRRRPRTEYRSASKLREISKKGRNKTFSFAARRYPKSTQKELESAQTHLINCFPRQGYHGDLTGSRQSKEVIYCVYSAR